MFLDDAGSQHVAGGLAAATERIDVRMLDPQERVGGPARVDGVHQALLLRIGLAVGEDAEIHDVEALRGLRHRRAHLLMT